MKKISIISILMLCVVLLCACSSKFEYEKNMLVDNKTGIRYHYAPFCYEPVAFGEKYATQEKAGIETVYYKLGKLSSDEWLTNEDLIVFYAEGVVLPTLKEFMADRFLVCEESDDTILSILDIDDKDKVSKIINEYLSAEVLSGIPKTADISHVLKFRSSAYPYLQYSLYYLEYENGLIVTDNTDSLEGYKYLYGENVADITEIQNEDGSYTVEYDLGKYFLYNKYEGTYARIGDTVSLELS